MDVILIVRQVVEKAIEFMCFVDLTKPFHHITNKVIKNKIKVNVEMTNEEITVEKDIGQGTL